MSERRRNMLRAVGRVALRMGAVAVVGALAAATAAMALLGDTVKSYLGSDVVDISDEELDAVMEAGRTLAERVEAEGMVLLRNEDSTLPLDDSVTKVNVFGWASVDWVASGSGSGQVAGDTLDLLEALTEQGVAYNEQLTSMYRSFASERAYAASGALNSHASEYCRLYEPSINDESLYTPELLADAKEFSTTAIVVISRTTGESIDCPQVQYKVGSDGQVDVDVTRTYLELSSEEEALLRYVGANYAQVVVVVNSTNTMELGELETTPGVDAALLVGTTGEMGARSVVKALWGEINPSGRTTDTFAYDLSTAASYANAGAMGEGLYTNAEGLYPADGTLNANVGTSELYDGVRFVDYVEGIYVGYRWYETADAEGFWDEVTNSHGTGYEAVVQYPFGYGLSYTSFAWEVVARTPGSNSRADRSTTFSITVRVTNTGQVAGRDVVQLYCTPPYVEGGVEKSSTVLVDYAKTGLIEPGESQDVVLTFSLEDVASYDCYDANGNGYATYELDAGSYVVELKRNAHELATCDYAQTTLWVAETQVCSEDAATGVEVGNRFTGDAAEDGVSIDGSDSGANISYLTRADFAGSFPRTSDPDREMTANVAALNLYGEQDVELDALGYQDAVGEGAVSLDLPSSTRESSSLVLCEDGELTSLGVRLGLDYDDAGWDTLLDALSLDDLERLTLHGYLATAEIEEIGKPLTKEVDGPAQVGSFNQLSYGVGYPNPTVLAQTWNTELAREVGRQVGLECAAIGVDGWYAPCVNVHRTPLGGRNYEYYSEDPLICGEMGAAVAAGSREAGTYCYIKHLAVNNQDSYRDSLYTWLTEQTLREIYLTPFRTCVRSGATGFMSSYNRIGATWAGGNKALLTGVLRDEWGFCGTVITDYCDHQTYMSADQSLRAGGSLYMDGVFRDGAYSFGLTAAELEDAAGTGGEARAASYVANLRRAAKDVLYTWLNARATNLAYNEAASETGAATLDRALKTSGFDYVGTALALADAAAFTGAVLWVHRALARRRSRRSRRSRRE